MTLYEPGVTLTDYLLTLECGLFAVLLARSGPVGVATVRFAFVTFFGAAASASLFGGTVHGFFPPDATSAGNRALWIATMLSVGLTALAGLVAGTRLCASRSLANKLTPVFTFLYVIYGVVVIFFRNELIVAIYFYVPATVFLLGVFVWLWTTAKNPGALWGIAGVLLTFAAAGVQVGEIALHPTYLNHNVLFHLVQAIAMYLLFRAALSVGEGSSA